MVPLRGLGKGGELAGTRPVEFSRVNLGARKVMWAEERQRDELTNDDTADSGSVTADPLSRGVHYLVLSIVYLTYAR